MDNDLTDIMTGNSNEIRPHPPENEWVWVGVGEANKLSNNFPNLQSYLEAVKEEYLASGHLTKFYEDYPEIVKWASNNFSFKRIPAKTGSQVIANTRFASLNFLHYSNFYEKLKGLGIPDETSWVEIDNFYDWCLKNFPKK